MSHENRKQLESKLNHAKNYIARLFMQFVSNLLQTLKGQQIIQVLVCTAISLLFSILLGVIDSDKVLISVKGFVYFCVTLLTLCVGLNILTAVLHLDREREIEVLNNPQKKIRKSNELSILPEKTEYDWLVEYAQKQEQNIALSVEIDKVVYSRSDLEGYPFFYIVFALNVFNKSVYPITFDEKIGNKLIYAYESLKLNPTFDEPPPVIKPLDTGTIRINQRLEKDEAESVSRALETFETECVERSQNNAGGHPIPKKIEFKDLVLTIKSTGKFKKVEPREATRLFLEFEVTKKNFNFQSAVIKSPTIVELEKEVEKYKNKLAKRSEILNANEWLIKETGIQASRINEYVYWKKSFYSGNLVEDRIHFLLFVLEFYNASVFEVVIDNPINGKMLIADRRMTSEKIFGEPPQVIYPNTGVNLMIRQYLTDEEADFINQKVFLYNQQREGLHKEMPKKYHFYSREWLFGTTLMQPPIVELKNLELTIKGSSASSQIKPAVLTKMADVRTSIENFTKFI